MRGGRRGILCAALLAAAPALLAEEANPAARFEGIWTGSARLTNEWASPVCQYRAGDSPPAVRLEVEVGDAGKVKATIDLDVKAPYGCPALKKHYEISDVIVAGSAITFNDAAGASWNLAVRVDVLHGIIAWRGGTVDEPLSEGFVGPDGVTPLLRLNGEVALKRKGPAPSDVKAPVKAGVGSAVRGTALVIGANVVAAGALILVNKATQDTGQTASQFICSGRSCSIGTPCVCNSVPAVGQSCGTTPSGGTPGAVCNSTTLPCASNLSCNQFRCEDLTGGSCPP